MSYCSKETSTDHKHKLLSDLITTRIISGHVETNRDGSIVVDDATTTATTSTASTTDDGSDSDATTTTSTRTISCGTLITMLNNFARIIRDVKPRYVSKLSSAYIHCHMLLCSKLTHHHTHHHHYHHHQEESSIIMIHHYITVIIIIITISLSSSLYYHQHLSSHRLIQIDSSDIRLQLSIC